MGYSEKTLSILRIAKKLFAEKGYNSVSTREIAKRAGVNEVTIYRQFQSKKNLFERMIRHYYFHPDLSGYLDQSEKDPKKYLTSAGNLIQIVFRKNLDLYRIELLDSRMMPESKPMAGFMSEIKGLMTVYLLTSGRFKNKEANILAFSFVSAVHGICMNLYFFRHEPELEFRKCLKLIVKKFVKKI